MGRYLIRRLLQTIVILWVISAITFFLFWITPANPALLICGRNCNTETVATVNATYGFDKPLIVQYGTYMKGLVSPTGREIGSEGNERTCAWPCFGESYQNGIPVWESISTAFPATFWLASGAAVIWLFFGVLLGLIAALRKGKAIDKLSVGLALFGVSFPTIVFGYLLLYLFIVKLQWPVPGHRELGAVHRRSTEMDAVLHPAVDDARAGLRGAVHPAHPGQHDRHDERGLHPYRPGQGPG
ncbi:ABC transporter permease [Kribbella sp. NPDC023855]|uniref:ABC transporter permease n=1 Tax=Kribbella sp. NPDC023855 TaxID=3154698 RepID=UPI0033FE9B20